MSQLVFKFPFKPKYYEQDYYFSSNSLLNLLEGELILDKKEYQYLGKSLDFKNINATMEN